MKNPRAALSFSASALFCVVALITRIAGSPLIIPLLAIIIAGVALVLGLRQRTDRVRTEQPVMFTEEQSATIRELKGRGQEAAAIRQAQLWSRGFSATAVAAAVKEL